MESATAHARVPKQGRSRQSFERIIEATIELLLALLRQAEAPSAPG